MRQKTYQVKEHICTDCGTVFIGDNRRRCIGCRLTNSERKGRAKNTHKLVNLAVRYGLLVKPSTCSACIADTKLFGHHPDYAKPLEVVWLCDRYHKDVHIALGSYA